MPTLHFVRPGGWHCISNFSTEPVALPEGVVLGEQRPDRSRRAAGETTVWFTEWPEGRQHELRTIRAAVSRRIVHDRGGSLS